MVVLIVLLTLLIPVSGHALSKEELHELNNAWLAKEAERERNLDTGNLNSLLPKKEDEEPLKTNAPIAVPSEAPAPTDAPEKKQKKPLADRYSVQNNGDIERPQAQGLRSGQGEAQAAPLKPGISPRIFEQGKDGLYISPPRVGGYDALVDAPMPDETRVFGIRIGTWIKGELRRPANSSEPGLVEIYTTEAIRGDRKVLPIGSILFAEKTYNAGTKKQDFLVEKGITPQGREFKIKGLVFDLNQTAGLDGIVSTDSEMIVERSGSKGALAAGGAVADQLAGNSLVGAASSAAAESLLEDSAEAVTRSKTLKQNIRTRPQTLLIRVEETF